MYNVHTGPATTGGSSRNGTHHFEVQTHQKALSSNKAIAYPGNSQQRGAMWRSPFRRFGKSTGFRLGVSHYSHWISASQ